ncbi:GRF1-interacting factor 1 isoform X1 [Quercus robur]|nr:GRF1-interacting factor 1 isoform X1 [Quercus robur]
MQQHLMQMQPMMAPYYPNNVTTDHIQQYLDENKSLILKIVESQNSGKMSECAENQARLQRNLMYLAAIADSQPQPPTMHGQFPPSGIMQPGAHYMQHQQAQQMTPQSLMAARSSMLYSQQPYSALQQQQALHSQLGMNSSGSSGLHMLQSDASHAGGSGTLGVGGFADFGRGSTGEGLQSGRGMAGGSKQDIGSAGSAEGRGGSSTSHDGGETLYLKAADDGN